MKEEHMLTPARARLSVVATAGALALGVAASPVQAQQKQGGQVTQGNLIAALNNINLEIDRLNALNDLTITDVRVVNVEDVANNNRALNNALNRNDVDVLRNFLNNSLNNNNVEILNDALNNNNVNVSDVVAINVLSGDRVVIFEQ
jgi:hypothetical protein